MKKRWTLALEVVLLAGLGAWIVLSMMDWSAPPPGGVGIKVQLPGADDKAWIVGRDGRTEYVITLNNGQRQTLTPDEFADRVYRARKGRSWAEVVLNVSSPWSILWVAVGFLGQVLFTGRMLVQWLASEKRQKSVVPPAFWWMSLAGATMLLVYFMWRRDPVGILGQAFGWFIYLKNLYLIYVKEQGAGPRVQGPAEAPEQPASV